MKALICAIILLCVGNVAATIAPASEDLVQPQTNAPALNFHAPPLALVQKDIAPTRPDTIQSGSLTVAGPLVRPAKAESVLDVPLRLLQLFNPLAPTEKPEQRESAPERADLSPRAWTAAAGWRPGQSAFPDPLTHEPQLPLLTFYRSPGR